MNAHRFSVLFCVLKKTERKGRIEKHGVCVARRVMGVREYYCENVRYETATTLSCVSRESAGEKRMSKRA